MKARNRKKAASSFQGPMPAEGHTSIVPPANTAMSGRTGITVPKAGEGARALDRTNYAPVISERQSRTAAGSGPGPQASGDVIVDVDEDGGSMVFWFVGKGR